MIEVLSAISEQLSAAAVAQVDYSMRLKGMRSAFEPNHGGPSEAMRILSFVAVFLALVVVLLIARSLWGRKTGKLASQRPARLFTRALRQLGVRLTDRILLRMAAKDSGLRQPTVMLFSPELLERYAGRWADSIPLKPLREHARKRVQVLAEKAFVQET